MIYLAKIEKKHFIQPFEDTIPLKLNHKEILPGEVSYIDQHTLKITTPLEYELGQGVSIGGFDIGKNKYNLNELSITDYPVFEEAMIYKKEDE
ncbi:hypothetical protein [Lactococcus fujiensis]|uniref:hypothetical protein n=1 Tax=Lactococcus fujiensis TaxID=610251 RepID=UPI0006D13B59|nr:hypothetical protein [Lactococcus fujiensis]